MTSILKCTSPDCSKAPPQHDAATPVLHRWDGVLQLASLVLFPPNITMVIMAKQFYFCFYQTFLQKVQSLSPCAVANRSLAYLWRFWSSGFFLAEWPFRLCWYWTRFTVDIDHFAPVSSTIFTRSFAVLGLICTFSTKVRSSLGDRTCLLPERYDGCLVPWCFYLHTIVCTDERGTFRHLEIASKDEPDLWRSTIEVLADLFWFSHDVKKRGTKFECRPWNTSTGTPPIDSNYVN